MPARRNRRLAPILSAIIAISAFAISYAAPPAGAVLSSTYGTVLDFPSSTTDISEVRFLAEAVFTGGAKAAAAVQVGDANNDDVVQTTEGWYVDLDGTGTVTVGDVRLTSVGSFSAFSIVKTGDNDNNVDLDAAGGLCYTEGQLTFRPAGTYNSESTGITQPNMYHENVYIDISGACGTVAADDVRLVGSNTLTSSGGSAGGRVATGNGDIGNATVAMPAAARFRAYDLDNSATYTLNDGVYFDVDNSGYPTPGDIRITAWGSLTAGTVVKTGDIDAAPVLEVLGVAPQFVFVDGNVDGTFTCASEALYWDNEGTTTITRNDYRITAVTGTTSYSAGTQVATGNADITATNVVAINARIKYYDGNLNGAYGFGDTLYLDADNSNTVTAGDLRIVDTSSSQSSNTCITSSSSDRNLVIGTAGLTLRFRYIDNDAGNTFTRGDLPYLDNDNDGFVSLGDVRMSSHYSTFGSVSTMVGDNSPDRYYSFPANVNVNVAAALRFQDGSGNNAIGADEPIYIAMGGTANVRTADVRLSSGVGSCAAGTQVQTSDSCGSDFNNPTVALGAAVLRYAEEGSKTGAFNKADFVYVDVDADGRVSVGDVRLVSRGSGSIGSRVLAGNSDLSDTLNDFPNNAFNAGRIRILKTAPSTATSFSATYVVGDIVVYDTNNDGFPTLGDIVLSGSGGATSSSSSGGGGSSGGGSQQPSTPQPSAAFSMTIDEPALRINVNAAASTAPTGRTISSYFWNFGDGASGSGVQTSHTYGANGNYVVTLTVTDSAGQTSTASRTAIIGTATPTQPTQPTAPSDPTDPTGPTEPTGPTGPTDPTDGDDGDEDDGDQVGTPGPSVVLLLAALALLGVAVRRRQ